MRKILFITLFLVALQAFAELPPSADLVLISLSPENPAPNTLVEASLSLLAGGNLSQMEVEWVVNGKSVSKGKGVASATFRTGAFGSVTTLIITLSEGGETISKALSLKPASVLLVSESDGTAPPFYRGKTLFTYHGSTRIAAIPFFAGAGGARMNPKTLSYTWRIADRVPENSSGVGRDSFMFYARTPFRPTEVTVTVSTPDGSAVAEGKIVAEALAPAVFFYEEHPLYGVLWNRALTTAKELVAPEMHVRAQPFFFNKNNASLLKYDWTQNYQKVGSPSDESIVFRNEGAEGEARIRVSVTNPNAMFQFGEAKTTLRF